jgi:hypothetical protein
MDEPPQVLVLQEPDYRFGVGTIRIQVSHIDWDTPSRYDGEVWYPAHGVQVRGDNTEIETRLVLVRGRRLPRPRTGGPASRPEPGGGTSPDTSTNGNIPASTRW